MYLVYLGCGVSEPSRQRASHVLTVKNVSRALRSISLTLVCRRMVRSGGCERTSGAGLMVDSG